MGARPCPGHRRPACNELDGALRPSEGLRKTPEGFSMGLWERTAERLVPTETQQRTNNV
jgi:hypothetical protein